MFIMTVNIKVGPFKAFKPTAVSWKRSVDNYSDSSLIKLPAMCVMKSNGDTYQKLDTGLQFKEGMPVDVECGYLNKSFRRFKGFIRRINYTVPCEIECEGYSYQLRQKLNINKVYRSGVKMKTILTDLIEGTDIKLSPLIPDVTIEQAVVFQNASGVQVLDWFKEKMLQSVYFNFDVLYVGLRETEIKGEAKFRLGWNVIKDNELKFNDNKEHSDVQIKLQQRGTDGEFTREVYESKFTSTLVKRIQVRLTPDYLAKMAKDVKTALLSNGYEGRITAFGVPYVEPGMTVSLDDPRFNMRKGKNFVESVDGDFSTGGVRQSIKLGNTL